MKKQAIDYMRILPLFNGFEEMEVDMLSSAMTIQWLPANEELYAEGSLTHAMFIVAAGRLRQSIEDKNGDPVDLGEAGPNCILGHKSLIDKSRNATTVEAVVQSVVLRLDGSDFQSLFSANSKFAYKMLDFVVTDLAKRVRETGEMFNEILENPSKETDDLIKLISNLGNRIFESQEFVAPV